MFVSAAVLTLPWSPTPPTSFSEEDFRWCVMAVAWWILQKGKNIRPCGPLPSIQGRFSCRNKRVSSGLAPRISQRSAAVSLRPAMAAHKPVEWVQAVITRFDEQVRWADSGDGCSKLWSFWGPSVPADGPPAQTRSSLLTDLKTVSRQKHFMLWDVCTVCPNCKNTEEEVYLASAVSAVN